jgi:hypothetical protein
MRLFAATFSALALSLAGCDGPRPAATAPAPHADKKPEPPAAKRPPKKSHPPERKVPGGEPTKSRKEKFAAAWAGALEEGERLDAAEPAATAKALKLLTGGERAEAGGLQFNPGVYLPKFAPRLVELGLSDWVARESRRVALADATFKPLAETVWDEDSGAGGISRMMHAWGRLTPPQRLGAASAAGADTPTARLSPEVRDAFLALGARKWLER